MDLTWSLLKMFSTGILQQDPELSHPDFVVRMCCQGLKPGKLVWIRFVKNITRLEVRSHCNSQDASPFCIFLSQVLASKVFRRGLLCNYCQFILGNFSFCGCSLVLVARFGIWGEKHQTFAVVLSIRWSFFSNFASGLKEMVIECDRLCIWVPPCLYINSVLEKNVRKMRRRTCEKAAKFRLTLQPSSNHSFRRDDDTLGKHWTIYAYAVDGRKLAIIQSRAVVP